MKVVLTGKGGQLAWEFERLLPQDVKLSSLNQSDLDITDAAAVADTLKQLQADVVVNAAAYTAVDKAESESDLAYAVNADGAKNLALACKGLSARLLHVSTDFIFDGTSSTPYFPDATPNPLSVYGASKLAGDKAVLDVLPDNSVIVRTAWVYSANGNNFVKTMLRLMREKSQLGIVCDQVGSPTWAKGLAQWLWKVCANKSIIGVFHWTDAGIASWYDFAVAIQELALEKGLLDQAIPLKPIPASSYPTPARRPAYSVLDKSSAEKVASMETVHWRKQLSQMMDEL